LSRSPLTRNFSSTSSLTAKMDFEKKVALITGSVAGIGQHTALMLAKQGACITLHGYLPDEAKETTELFAKANIPKENIHVVLGDISKKAVREQLVSETVQKFGKLDILINNVGATSLKNDSDFSSMDSLRHVLEINVVCAAELSQLSVPHLMKTKGNIVNVSSTMSMRPAFIGQWYGVSKAALDQYTRISAAMYGPAGIRVNAIRIGAVNTKIYASHGLPKLTHAFLEQVKYHSLEPRIAEPDEVAEVITFLANNKKASFVTGSIYGCDGGLEASYITPPENFLELVKELPWQSNGLFGPKPGSS
jgi:NAD(P)-dependent dehydrogenase (short-subunit alcohol dehydrogenase family)